MLLLQNHLSDKDGFPTCILFHLNMRIWNASEKKNGSCRKHEEMTNGEIKEPKHLLVGHCKFRSQFPVTDFWVLSRSVPRPQPSPMPFGLPRAVIHGQAYQVSVLTLLLTYLSYLLFQELYNFLDIGLCYDIDQLNKPPGRTQATFLTSSLEVRIASVLAAKSGENVSVEK